MYEGTSPKDRFIKLNAEFEEFMKKNIAQRKTKGDT